MLGGVTLSCVKYYSEFLGYRMNQIVKGPWFGEVCNLVRRLMGTINKEEVPCVFGRNGDGEGVLGRVSPGNGFEWELGVAYLGEGILGKANA